MTPNHAVELTATSRLAAPLTLRPQRQLTTIVKQLLCIMRSILLTIITFHPHKT